MRSRNPPKNNKSSPEIAPFVVFVAVVGSLCFPLTR